ncbi:MAG TPA: clostripain-related cysteine peptidase, partial [Pseudothermotoga sp.]
NNLEYNARRDLEEMKNYNNNVSVITFFDGKDEPDAIYALDEFGEQQKICTFDQDLDSGNKDSLLKWMDSIFGEYESFYRALILWDHGNAWIYDSKNLSSTYTPKAICFDETSKISTAELREVLESYTGPEIDLLCMDACLMGSIEVLYELKGLVDYVVASSFSVPVDGYNYSFLNQITPTDNALSVGEKIVEAYKKYYDGNNYWENEGLSLAVYDMSKVEFTTYYVDLLGKRLSNVMNSSIRNTIHSLYQYLTVYYYLKDQDNVYYPVLVDLNDCAYRMQSIDDSDVQNYAQQIQNSLDQLVVYEYVEKTNRVINNPVSIFMPKSINTFNSYINDYSTLLFKDLKWDDFLQSWLK